MKRQRVLIIFWCIISAYTSELVAVSVGSNTIASRQARIFYGMHDTDNIMQGFTVFEKGITLEDSLTTCSFEAFFPISGDIVLNGGSLFMLRNLKLENPFTITPGIIDAQGLTIEFPDNASSIEVPTVNQTRLLSLVQEVAVGQEIMSVDWSYDDQYVAVATKKGINELKIYYFHDNVLTLTLSRDFGSNDVNSVRWHPSDYYLALGQSGGVELQIYYLDIPSGVLENTDGFDAFELSALAWSPDGIYLAAGGISNSSFIVWNVVNGVLGNAYSGVFGELRTVQPNALDWKSDGNYIALGLETGVEKEELQVFEFTGSSLIKNSEVDLESRWRKGAVYAVGWKPGTDYLSIGYSYGSERIRLYEHDASSGTLTEKITARVASGQTVYGLDWDPSGALLAVGKIATTEAHELEVFTLNSSAIKLNLCAGVEFETGEHVKDIAWSHSGDYILLGDITGVLKIFNLEERPLIFRNAQIFFKTDITFTGPIICEGECVINGGGNIFSFDGSGSIAVASGGELYLENALLRLIGENDLACSDDTGVMTLRNVTWEQDSIYTFSVGALRFKNNVLMMGDTTFAYSSAQTSTILSKSNLEFDVGFTFSYDPGSESKTLLELVDNTSRLVLNGATLHATVTGMELTKGKLFVKGDSTVSSELGLLDGGGAIDEGIILGNGVEAEDLICQIRSGAFLNVAQGSLVYKNIASSSWFMYNDLSTLKLLADTRLILQEDLDLGEGRMLVSSQAYVDIADGKFISGPVFISG